ncbi:MAG: diaminopimelate epimerase [Desulfobacterales bacterium]|nr:diaminopimelate epimerase [Desulfobacterales bacterium]
MPKIPFFKMSGSGNDFIIIDNREGVVAAENIATFVRNVCCRRMSAGGDGLILVEKSDAADFKWQFFNSDGSLAEMCGNGARCVARFAYVNGITGSDMSFETDAGIVSATVSDRRVKISMPDPDNLTLSDGVELASGPLAFSSVNTGVPHVVIPVGDIDSAQVVEIGREIRYHQKFKPAGTNVNFISLRPDGVAAVRTYERGVEDETLACGTGAIACAVVLAAQFKKPSPIDVETKSGGTLRIYFKENNGHFFDIFLEGDARIIYKGKLWEDAWNYGRHPFDGPKRIVTP